MQHDDRSHSLFGGFRDDYANTKIKNLRIMCMYETKMQCSYFRNFISLKHTRPYNVSQKSIPIAECNRSVLAIIHNACNIHLKCATCNLFEIRAKNSCNFEILILRYYRSLSHTLYILPFILFEIIFRENFPYRHYIFLRDDATLISSCKSYK